MKRLSLSLLACALLGSTALMAQQNDAIGITLRPVWVNASSDQDLGTDGRIDFGGSSGLAIAGDVRFGPHFSIELEGARLPMDASLVPADALGAIDMGELSATSATLMGRFHFLRHGRLDPYAGAGVTYLTYGDIESTPLRSYDIESIELDSSVGPVIGAGMNVNFGRFGLNLDAKYRSLTTDTRAMFVDGDTSNTVELDLKPFTLAAGVRLHF